MPEAKNNPPSAPSGESKFLLGQAVITRNALSVLHGALGYHSPVDFENNLK